VAAPIDLAPADLAGYEASRQALGAELVAWGSAAGRALHPDIAEQLIHYKWGYLDDHLARWSCADLDKILLELFPAKMMLAPDEAGEMIEETRTFLQFLSEAGYLDPDGDSLAVLWRHLGRMGPTMRRRLGDASLFSWGKATWMAMAKEGIGPDNERAVYAWRTRFNALSVAEKEKVLGGAMRTLPAGAGPGRFAPRTPASPRSQPKRGRR